MADEDDENQSGEEESEDGNDICFSVRVVDEDGDGLEGIEVKVSYPWTHDEDYTDEDGWVHFQKSRGMWNGVRTDIFVKDEKMADQIWIEDGDSFSYTIPES